MITMTWRMKSSRWIPLVSLPFVAGLLWTAQAVGLAFVQVKGPSMTPSYSDGQVLFVNRLAYGIQVPIIRDQWWNWKAPNIGDPVVVNRPEEGVWVVKRVAATSGTPLKIADHKLVLPTRQVDLTPAQEYWLSACDRVPEGALFVLGDNEPRSQDSRDWGFVSLHAVVGRALF